MSGDWTLRGQDLDQRYAKFERSPLSDQEVWNLGKARIVCDGNSHIGMMLYLTSRSETTVFAHAIRDWALMVGDGIAAAMYKPPGAKRRRRYSELAQIVLRQAALDGAVLAMFGPLVVPSPHERRQQFGVRDEAYRKIRDFVGGVAATLLANYSFALEYAWGHVRSRVCDSIIEQLSRDGLESDDTVGYPDSTFPQMAKGCHRTPPLQDLADSASEDWQQPETLYPSLKQDPLWHPERK